MFEDLPEFSENYYKKVQLLTSSAERCHEAVVVHNAPIITMYINYLHIAKIVIHIDVNTGEVTSTTVKDSDDVLLNIKCKKIVSQYKRFVHDVFNYSALR